MDALSSGSALLNSNLASHEELSVKRVHTRELLIETNSCLESSTFIYSKIRSSLYKITILHQHRPPIEVIRIIPDPDTHRKMVQRSLLSYMIFFCATAAAVPASVPLAPLIHPPPHVELVKGRYIVQLKETATLADHIEDAALHDPMDPVIDLKHLQQ